MNFKEGQEISREISIIEARIGFVTKYGARSNIIHDDDLDAIITAVERIRAIADIPLSGFDLKNEKAIRV